MTSFLNVYSPDVGSKPWSDISGVVASLNWTDYVSNTATEVYDQLGINGNFTREEVESALRVNFGQASRLLLPLIVRLLT